MLLPRLALRLLQQGLRVPLRLRLHAALPPLSTPPLMACSGWCYPLTPSLLPLQPQVLQQLLVVLLARRPCGGRHRGPVPWLPALARLLLQVLAQQLLRLLLLVLQLFLRLRLRLLRCLLLSVLLLHPRRPRRRVHCGAAALQLLLPLLLLLLVVHLRLLPRQLPLQLAAVLLPLPARWLLEAQLARRRLGSPLVRLPARAQTRARAPAQARSAPQLLPAAMAHQAQQIVRARACKRSL